MSQRWVQVGKTDAEANVPVEPSPVTETEFDDMVRSCVRNDAMEKVRTKRAALAKRLQVCYYFCTSCVLCLVNMLLCVVFAMKRCFYRTVYLEPCAFPCGHGVFVNNVCGVPDTCFFLYLLGYCM